MAVRSAVQGAGLKRTCVVLIVDDDPIVREAMARALEDDAHTIVHSDNGLHALELMRSLQVDAVIADLNMPVMNGTRFLTYVRDMFPTCARLMISGSRRSDIAELSQAGIAKAFVLCKGAPPDELRARVREAVANRLPIDGT